MKISPCTNYVKIPTYKTLEIYDASPEDLINELENMLDNYPYTYHPTVGDPYQVTHCTLSLEEEDYEDIYSVVVSEWREITKEERETVRKTKVKEVESKKKSELETLEKLMKKYKKELL
jgi:hypothetical protein